MARRIINDAADFKACMTDIANAMQEDFVEVLQKLALDAFRSVIRRSPVKSGYLRHNWDVSVDATPSEQPKSPEGQKKYAPGEFDTGAYSIKFNSIIIIYNNTEYAIHIEEGTPKMRSQPMVRPTQVQLNLTARKLVTALSKKGYDI